MAPIAVIKFNLLYSLKSTLATISLSKTKIFPAPLASAAQALALINEYKIDESLGFQFNNADAVDFNCDGNISINSINTDINLDGSIGVLSDYNEWDNLELNFNQFRAGALNGAILTFSQNNSNRYLNHSAANIFHDNNAQIIHEELMPFNILHNFKRL